MARMEILTSDEEGVEEESNRTEAGGTLTWVANQSHEYNNTGREVLRIVKGSGAAVMTIETHAPDRYGLELPDRTVDVDANSTKYYGPYSRKAHNQRTGADKNYTSIAFSNIAGLEVSVVRLGEELS